MRYIFLQKLLITQNDRGRYLLCRDLHEISFWQIKEWINEELPLLNRAQAGILLEVMKDMFYQCFVRRGKLARAIKVRRFFVTEANNDNVASA